MVFDPIYVHIHSLIYSVSFHVIAVQTFYFDMTNITANLY